MKIEQNVSLLAALESLSHDFKASVVGAELADNGIAPDTLFFRNQSTFKRPVSKDIEEIFWDNITDDAGHLVFELNREGIYDMLPEALIHNQSRKKGADEKLGSELRRQEREARKFFSPLENEFHHRGLELDIIERELLKNNNPKRTREFFNYFFEDSSILTDQQLLVLMHILPLSHKIRGDLGLIALSISKILNYQVSISERWIRQHYALASHSNRRLSGGTLGADTILNDHFTIPSRYFDISISGITADDYAHFTGSGKHINVLNFILPYFFPATANYGMSLQCNADEAALVAGDAHRMSFLGFNSYI
jgi:hypothetical protein